MNNSKAPRNPHGPGPRPIEKAKDFKGAIKRLLKELKDFKILITIALLLAAFGSILSITAPNIISDLTNEISAGLVINTKNLETLETNLETKENEFQSKLIDILLSDSSLSKEEFLQELQSENISDYLTDSTYNGVTVTKEDKIKILKAIQNETYELEDNVMMLLLDEMTIDGITISKEDQVSFITLLKKMDSNDKTAFYQIIDESPESIQKILAPTMNIDKIKRITLFVFMLYLLSALFTYIESISMTKVSNNFARMLRRSISKKTNRLPLKYFDSHTIGDTLSRVTNDIDTIAQSMNQSLATLVSAITLFIGSIIMMFVTNWIMAITAIVSSLFGFIFMSMVLSKSQKYFTQKQEGLGELNGHIEEIYSGLNVVKVYNGKKQSDLKFDELNEKMFEANRKSQFLSGLMAPMMSFVGNFGYVAVCIVGALLTMNGTISFGVIVAFIMYVRLFTSPLSQIAQALTSLQSTAAASERVYEFLDEEEMSNQAEIKKMLEKKKVKGNIEFKDVTFTYDGNETPTIKHFSASAKPGEKIAIVGPTGAGKTTMVNLLMKFYEIQEGDILIDGTSIHDLSRENIHSLFTMVLQDTWLFNGTIKENIIYNRKNIDDEQIKEVCKTVGLDHYIKTLPKGYDTILSDNDSISSGQRQLLTIARGMLTDSPFLILDEATSNVDTRTEELVQKAMDKLTEGKTSFIIAHRLSTIKNADLILVMKDGNIIETGSHEELMKQNGFYADLYNSQFEL